jgi:hypothetical protein
LVPIPVVISPSLNNLDDLLKSKQSRREITTGMGTKRKFDLDLVSLALSTNMEYIFTLTVSHKNSAAAPGEASVRVTTNGPPVPSS